MKDILNRTIALIIIILIMIIIGIFLYEKYEKYTKDDDFKVRKYKKNDYNTYDPNNNNIKILHLVLYSKDQIYAEMYKLTRKYYELFDNLDNITTYYYCFDNTLTQPEIKDDIILIPGTETYIPGILDKTIKALDITRGMDYEYVLRSNISTIVNFKLLTKFLKKNKMDYGGSYINYIEKGYTEPNYGIKDQTFEGLSYISGIGIILSRKLVNFMLDNRDKFDYSVIDDVSIGKFVKDYTTFKPVTQENITLFLDLKKIRKIRKYLSNTIFYRNRNDNRSTDLKMMENIINKLIF